MFSKIIWRPSNRHDRQGGADDISPTKLVDYHATRAIRFVSQVGTYHPIVAAGNSFDTLPSRLKVWRESRRFHPPTHQSVIFMFSMGPNGLTEEVVYVSSSFFGSSKPSHLNRPPPRIASSFPIASLVTAWVQQSASFYQSPSHIHKTSNKEKVSTTKLLAY